MRIVEIKKEHTIVCIVQTGGKCYLNSIIRIGNETTINKTKRSDNRHALEIFGNQFTFFFRLNLNIHV